MGRRGGAGTAAGPGAGAAAMGYDLAAAHRLMFGRHRGRTIAEVAAADRAYLLWLRDAHGSEALRRVVRRFLQGPSPVTRPARQGRLPLRDRPADPRHPLPAPDPIGIGREELLEELAQIYDLIEGLDDPGCAEARAGLTLLAAKVRGAGEGD